MKNKGVRLTSEECERLKYLANFGWVLMPGKTLENYQARFRSEADKAEFYSIKAVGAKRWEDDQSRPEADNG